MRFFRTVRELIEEIYQTSPPAKELAFKTVLVVGFDVHKPLKGVDVFPHMTHQTYHTVIINGERATMEAIKYIAPSAERLLHIDGVHLNKKKLLSQIVDAGSVTVTNGVTKGRPGKTLKLQQFFLKDVIVHWHVQVGEYDNFGKSTVIMLDGWHSHCNCCGECCSTIGHPKGADPFGDKGLDSPCHRCHGGSCEISCPELRVFSDYTQCARYTSRPSCCRNYPARNPACQFITPTCPLFNGAYIESARELEKISRRNNSQLIADHHNRKVTRRLLESRLDPDYPNKT